MSRWTMADLEQVGLNRLVRQKPPVKAPSKAVVQRKAWTAYQADQPEKIIQASILAYLRAKGVLCWKNRAVGIRKPDGAYIPIPKTERGVADIIGILPQSGRLLAVEVKRKGQYASDEQSAFLDNINKSGGLGFVARSIDDVQAQGI